MDDEIEALKLSDLEAGADGELAKVQYVHVMNTKAHVVHEQIRHNLARGLPEHSFTPARPEGEHILSLCGSGPSLGSTLPQLTGKVMAINAAIPTLVRSGVLIDYAMIWDATPDMVRYCVDAPGCEWMIASRCHPSVIDVLLAMGQKVTLWHVAGDGDETMEIFGSERVQVHGGAQGVTRGAFLACFMGFYHLHIFGADSSFAEETHVGGSLRDENEVMMVVEETGTVFRTTYWMMSQAEDWQGFVLPTMVANGIKVTMHGKGLLPFTHRLWVKNNPEHRELIA